MGIGTIATADVVPKIHTLEVIDEGVHYFEIANGHALK